jgi:uncharacterized protein (DUF433 family)
MSALAFRPPAGTNDEMSSNDKASQKWLVRYHCEMLTTSYQYLTQIPGVRSGRTIVDGTRIGVHDVIALTVTGASIDDVCRSFPELKRSQVYACLAYYEDHRGEIDVLVAEQMASGER